MAQLWPVFLCRPTKTYCLPAHTAGLGLLCFLIKGIVPVVFVWMCVGLFPVKCFPFGRRVGLQGSRTLRSVITGPPVTFPLLPQISSWGLMVLFQPVPFFLLLFSSAESHRMEFSYSTPVFPSHRAFPCGSPPFPRRPLRIRNVSVLFFFPGFLTPTLPCSV